MKYNLKKGNMLQIPFSTTSTIKSMDFANVSRTNVSRITDQGEFEEVRSRMSALNEGHNYDENILLWKYHDHGFGMRGGARLG
jgi:hypothetical protein